MREPGKPLEDSGALRHFRDKKPRRGRALIALALAAALGFGLFLAIRPAEAPEPADSTVALIARDKTLLKSISVAFSGGAPYTLINLNDYDLSAKNDVIGKEYVVEGDDDFAVSTAQVLAMERYATGLSAKEKVAASADDLAQYGLDAPGMTVAIGYRDGTREALTFGGPTPTGIGYYLMREGDPAVYIVAYTVYEAFHRPLSELEQSKEEKAEYADLNAEAGAEPGPAPTPESP